MKEPELFKGTNWEFNLAFKRKWKIATKSHPWSPCIRAYSPTSMSACTEAWKSLSIRWRKRWRGAKWLQVHHLVSLQFHGLVSRRARCTLPLHFISLLSHSWQFIPSHCLPHQTKYIYYPAACCRWAPLAGFPLLGRMQETRRRKRKEENKMWVNNSVCQASSCCKSNGGKIERGSNQYASLLIKQT